MLKTHLTKIFASLAYVVIFYLVTSMAEGRWNFADWSSTGSTIFFVLCGICILWIITYPSEDLQVLKEGREADKQIIKSLLEIQTKQADIQTTLLESLKKLAEKIYPS